jgi:hypothetical protein
LAAGAKFLSRLKVFSRKIFSEKRECMKRSIISLVMAFFLSAMGFSQDRAYLRSLIQSLIEPNSTITSVFPDTDEMADKIIRLNTDAAAYNRFVRAGWLHSPKKIRSDALDLQKALTKAELATAIKEYVVVETEKITASTGIDSEPMVKRVSRGVVTAVLNDTVVEAQLNYTWKEEDGTAGYGAYYILSCPKEPVDEEIGLLETPDYSGNKQSVAEQTGKNENAEEPVRDNSNREGGKAAAKEAEDGIIRKVTQTLDEDPGIQRWRSMMGN